MKADIKQQWLDALRSGEYEQGEGELCTDNDGRLEYCCLGVLARVVGFDPYRLENVADLSDIGRDDLLGPWSTPGESNIYEGTDEKTHVTVQRKLAAMNDHGRKSFAEIADWIEANVPVE